METRSHSAPSGPAAALQPSATQRAQLNTPGGVVEATRTRGSTARGEPAALASASAREPSRTHHAQQQHATPALARDHSDVRGAGASSGHASSVAAGRATPTPALLASHPAAAASSAATPVGAVCPTPAQEPTGVTCASQQQHGKLASRITAARAPARTRSAPSASSARSSRSPPRPEPMATHGLSAAQLAAFPCGATASAPCRAERASAPPPRLSCPWSCARLLAVRPRGRGHQVLVHMKGYTAKDNEWWGAWR